MRISLRCLVLCGLVDISTDCQMANFRKNFINKCIGDTGAVEADGEFLSEVLNGTDDIDLAQLRSYAWLHILTPNYRVQLYKILLGISSHFPENRKTIDQHREAEAHVLLKCLCTIHSFSGTFFEVPQQDPPCQTPIPTVWDIVKMILLARGELSECIELTTEPTSDEGTVAILYHIVKHVNQLPPCRWVDVFCISRALFALLDSTFNDVTLHQTIAAISHDVERQLGMEKEEFNLFIKEFPIELWLRSGMCALFSSEKAISKILDKICTGHRFVHLFKVLVTDFIIRVDESQRKGSSLESKRLRWVSADTEMRMVTRAIDITLRDMKKNA